MSNVWSGFKAWLAKPFSTDMDAFHWFLLFGLLIAISAAWALILKHTIGAIQE
jgi:hypothetical protein